MEVPVVTKLAELLLTNTIELFYTLTCVIEIIDIFSVSFCTSTLFCPFSAKLCVSVLLSVWLMWYQEEQNRGKANWEHLNEDLHVLITVEDSENRARIKLQRAVDEVKRLLVPMVGIGIIIKTRLFDCVFTV